jgi:hypothetical protein
MKSYRKTATDIVRDMLTNWGICEVYGQHEGDLSVLGRLIKYGPVRGGGVPGSRAPNIGVPEDVMEMRRILAALRDDGKVTRGEPAGERYYRAIKLRYTDGRWVDGRWVLSDTAHDDRRASEMKLTVGTYRRLLSRGVERVEEMRRDRQSFGRKVGKEAYNGGQIGV